MKEHGPDAIMDPTFRPIVRASFHQSQKIARQQTNKRRMEQEYGGDIFAFDNIQTVDEDGDGLITREDLMRALDTDGDGVVSSEELLAAMRTKARAGEALGQRKWQGMEAEREAVRLRNSARLPVHAVWRHLE